MIDPSLVKTVGFIAAVVGTLGSAAVLFLPRCLGRWEKSIRLALIAIALLGIISNRIGDYIISTANGPRNMSPADWSLLSDEMKAYRGEEYTIFLYTDEVEAIIFDEKPEDIFRQCWMDIFSTQVADGRRSAYRRRISGSTRAY